MVALRKGVSYKSENKYVVVLEVVGSARVQSTSTSTSDAYL